jgi:hypothetical protein
MSLFRISSVSIYALFSSAYETTYCSVSTYFSSSSAGNTFKDLVGEDVMALSIGSLTIYFSSSSSEYS